MTSTPLARHRLRALMAASSVSLLVGASFGAAWLGGHLARDADSREQARQIQQLSTLGQDGQPALADLDSVGGKPLDASAMHIAERFSRFDGQGADNALEAQNLNALRTSNSVMSEKNAGIRTDAMQAAADAVVADHPVAVRAASAFKFANHNQNDTDCLTQAVYYEARGEGTDGMRAVAQVILNRVRNPAYPKSICAVVYQGASQGGACQFSFACDDSVGAPVERGAWRRARTVAKSALDGYVMKGVGSATSFHTVAVHPGWAATMQRVATIGSHIFYQFRGHNVQLADSGVKPSALPAQTGTPTGALAANTPADDSAKTALLNALARTDSTVKPVMASAQVEGRAAQDIVSAITGEKAVKDTARPVTKDSVKPVTTPVAKS